MPLKDNKENKDNKEFFGFATTKTGNSLVYQQEQQRILYYFSKESKEFFVLIATCNSKYKNLPLRPEEPPLPLLALPDEEDDELVSIFTLAVVR